MYAKIDFSKEVNLNSIYQDLIEAVYERGYETHQHKLIQGLEFADYRAYTPGDDNQDKNQDPLAYPDACDIYLLLEVRDNSSPRRLATGWFRSSDHTSDLTTVEVPITYGELDDSFPEYMKPVDENYVRMDSAQFILPTHLTFVATSSFDGANFSGAVGSLLLLDNLELVYD